MDTSLIARRRMLSILAIAATTTLVAVATPTPGDSLRPSAEIREYVLRHVGGVRRCYQSEGLRRDPKLAGTIELRLTIAPTGIVDAVEVDDGGLAGEGRAEVAQCIARIARHWRFTRGPFDVEVHVVPFDLAPEMKRARGLPSLTLA